MCSAIPGAVSRKPSHDMPTYHLEVRPSREETKRRTKDDCVSQKITCRLQFLLHVVPRGGGAHTSVRLRVVINIAMSSSEPYRDVNDAIGEGGARPGGSRTAQIQAQIDETVGVMRDNINKVNERGENLDSLQDKTDNLSVSAQGFRRGASRVRKQMWWKDVKIRMLIALGIIALLCVIIRAYTLTCPLRNRWYPRHQRQ